MKPFVAVICCVLAALFAVVAATTARAAVTARSAFPPPVVVIYPFTVAGNTSSTATQTGGNVALLLANRLSELGGVDVKPFTPGTVRADYLTAATAQNADYYVTGFLTPIGSEVSLITQVVSTYAGTVIWSSTVSIKTYGDALGQVDTMRAAILAHAGRSLSAIAAQPPPASTPQPETSDAAGLNLTKALGRHHRAVTEASPSPSATQTVPTSSAAPNVVAVAPSRPRAAKQTGALVANVAGSGDATLRAYAATALVGALRRDGATHGGALAVDPHDAVAHAGDLCRANAGTSAVYVATVDVASDARSVTLDVAGYDCSGAPLGTHSATEAFRGRGEDRAVDRAATKTIDAFLRS
jgi:TolB-like protein